MVHQHAKARAIVEPGCLVALLQTEANLVSRRQLADEHISRAATAANLAELALAAAISVTEGGQIVTLHRTKQPANYRYITIDIPPTLLQSRQATVRSWLQYTEPSKYANISLAIHYAPQDQVNQRYESDTAAANTGEQGGLRSASQRWKPGNSADTS